MGNGASIQRISVIVPKNPFAPLPHSTFVHCLAALDVQKLMEWWPGLPHVPHRQPDKVTSIQRSLDWKRVCMIASYLLQNEIRDASYWLNRCFKEVYEPLKHRPGYEWPPRVPKVVPFQKSAYPTFSNILVHVNGAKVEQTQRDPADQIAVLTFDETNPNLKFSVIDGQHRVNGAYLAISIRRDAEANATWEIPSDVFVDLDLADQPPARQAQVFIDVNFYQKKVDRSLVADLFPTARARDAVDDTERAQDIGRRLMLEKPPLVGMIQIPGIKYGVDNVVTLATLVSAIKRILRPLRAFRIDGLQEQTDFVSQCLTSWLDASGRREELNEGDQLKPDNVAYQGRVLTSAVDLIPACAWFLKQKRMVLLSADSQATLTRWIEGIMARASLLENGRFLPRSKVQSRFFVGSGGVAKFRNLLWASLISTRKLDAHDQNRIDQLARKARGIVLGAENLQDENHVS